MCRCEHSSHTNGLPRTLTIDSVASQRMLHRQPMYKAMHEISTSCAKSYDNGERNGIRGMHHSRSHSWPSLLQESALDENRACAGYSVPSQESCKEIRSPSPPSIVEYQRVHAEIGDSYVQETEYIPDEVDQAFQVIIDLLTECCRVDDTRRQRRQRRQDQSAESLSDRSQTMAPSDLVEVSPTNHVNNVSLSILFSVASPLIFFDQRRCVQRVYISLVDIQRYEELCHYRLHGVIYAFSQGRPLTSSDVICCYQMHHRHYALYLPYMSASFIKATLRKRDDLFITSSPETSHTGREVQYYRAIGHTHL